MSEELIERELFYKIINLATNVHRELGQGLPEYIYKKALIFELEENNISYEANKLVDITYKKQKLDTFPIDLIVKNKILVSFASDDERKKQAKTLMLSLLRVLKKQTGLLLDYSHETLYYKRIVFKSKKEQNIESAY
ncbi:GxxExxY protein [bacterium]|nr:GxxExxY protein [bacterium]